MNTNSFYAEFLEVNKIIHKNWFICIYFYIVFSSLPCLSLVQKVGYYLPVNYVWAGFENWISHILNSKDFTRLFLWFPYFSSSKKLYFNLKSVLLTTWFTSQRHARFDNHSLQVKTLVFICFHLVICRFWGSSCSEMRSSIRSGKQEIARFCHDLFIISKCLLRGFQRSFEPQRLPDYPLNMVGCYREQAPMVAD